MLPLMIGMGAQVSAVVAYALLSPRYDSRDDKQTR